MEKLLAETGMLAGVVLLVTEALGRVLVWEKDRIAVVAGPLCALIAYGNGWIGPYGTGAWGWLAAVVFGGLGAVAAGVTNDYVVKPFQREKP